MLHVGLRGIPASRTLFHIALAGIFFPCFSAPIVILFAILAAMRANPPPEERPWTRALVGLAVLDLILGIGVVWFTQHPEAVPAHDAAPRGVIGVTLDDLVVRTVLPNAPAERAGVLPGDEIVALDGSPVTSRTVLQAELDRRDPGVERTLTVVRAGERRDLRITPQKLASRPLFEPIDARASYTLADFVALIASLTIIGVMCLSAVPGAPRLRLWGAFIVTFGVSEALPIALAHALGRSIGTFLVSMAAQSLVTLALCVVAMRWMPVPATPRRPALTTALLGAWYAVTGSLRVGFILILIDAIVLRGAIPSSNPISQLMALNLGALGLTLLICDVVVLGPVAEEALFRGFLLPRLVPQVGVLWAVASSSALFALAHPHYGLYAIVPLFFGLVFAWARLRSSLAAPIAIHIFVNAYVTLAELLGL